VTFAFAVSCSLIMASNRRIGSIASIRRGGLMYLKSEQPPLRYQLQKLHATGRSAMPSSDKRDLGELEVYKMLERLGIELGAGVVPRYGLMYTSAVRTCRNCGSVRACTEWLGATSATDVAPVAPGFCPNADLLFELELNGQTVSRSTVEH
jgi:hypothetical protein